MSEEAETPPSSDPTDEQKNDMRAEAAYYRKFHHEVMRWFFMIMSFSFGGIIAGSGNQKINLMLGAWGSLIVMVCFLLVVLAFYFVVSGYSKRVSVLNEMSENWYCIQKKNPSFKPAKWRSQHRELSKDWFYFPEGRGSKFFIFVCVVFTILNGFLLAGRLDWSKWTC